MPNAAFDGDVWNQAPGDVPHEEDTIAAAPSAMVDVSSGRVLRQVFMSTSIKSTFRCTKSLGNAGKILVFSQKKQAW